VNGESPQPPPLTALALEPSPPVALLKLRRPEKLNALTPAMLGEIATAAAWLDRVPGVASVIVCGAGRAFSAGFDLGAMADVNASGGDARATAALGRRAADALAAMRPVTVAAVHGRCVGGGIVLAASCDIVVAERDALFSIPELDLGIPLAWGGVPALVRAVGAARAKELILTCRAFDGAEAHAIGLATRLAGPGAARAAAEELARDIAARGRLNTAATKAHVRAAASGAAASAEAELDALVAALADPESAHARARYLEGLVARRRSPGGPAGDAPG